MDSVAIRSYSRCVSEHIVDSDIDEWRVRSASRTFLVTVIETLQDADTTDASVEWLCDPETVKQLEKDFLVATKASELTANEQLSIRVSTGGARMTPTVLLNPKKLVSLLPLSGDETVQMVVSDDHISERLWETYETEWEMGIPESIDTPPYSRVLSLADQKMGATVSEDLDSAYDAIECRSPDTRPEPVTVGLLVAAKHDLLLRDVVEWAETSTLATQGTVSKLKQQLEDIGVVTTDSENIGVGRPRQRLALADSSFESVPVDELVANVQSVLS